MKLFATTAVVINRAVQILANEEERNLLKNGNSIHHSEGMAVGPNTGCRVVAKLTHYNRPRPLRRICQFKSETLVHTKLLGCRKVCIKCQHTNTRTFNIRHFIFLKYIYMSKILDRVSSNSSQAKTTAEINLLTRVTQKTIA